MQPPLIIPENASAEKLRELLHESETRFSRLADTLPVMIWMTGPENLAHYFNQKWLAFTGKTFEQVAGTGWIQCVHPDDISALDKLEEKIEKHEAYNAEYRLRRADGEYRFIFEIGTPRILPDGAFAGYMGSCIDVTETKAAQNELAARAKELMRSNEELEQFAYVASHDLQEPLRMIISYVQLIQKNIEQNNLGRVGEFMNYVLDGTGRMQALINDLLQFSRVSRKGTPFKPVDLNEVLKIAVSHLTARINENKAVVTIPALPKVMGDNFQLIRLFQNLIDNAIKFKSPLSEPRIEIYVEERGEDYLFSVTDNGIGIEDKFYNRIFVIFQRLHTREDYEGTGIGLAVCKKIVERHGGEIWVKSSPGKGSTFYFTIKK